MTRYHQMCLALALNRPFPSRFDVGDVAPETTEVTTTEPTIREQLAGAADVLRKAQVLIWVGGAAVAVVAGVVGYAIGRSR